MKKLKIAAMIAGILGSAEIGLMGYAGIQMHSQSQASIAGAEKNLQSMRELDALAKSQGLAISSDPRTEEALIQDIERMKQRAKQTPIKAYLVIGLGLIGLVTSLFLLKSRPAGAVLMGIAGISFLLYFVTWLGAALMVVAGILGLLPKGTPTA